MGKSGKGALIMEEDGEKLQESKITGSLSEKVIRNHLYLLKLHIIHINLCINIYL